MRGLVKAGRVLRLADAYLKRQKQDLQTRRTLLKELAERTRELEHAKAERQLVSQEDERMRELLLQIKQERTQDRAAIRALTEICNLYATKRDMVTEVNLKHAAAIQRATEGK